MAYIRAPSQCSGHLVVGCWRAGVSIRGRCGSISSLVSANSQQSARHQQSGRLPGSSPCELRLMIPDDKLGKEGFHDVIIENLSRTPTWRSSHVSPAEVTTLHRQWPKAVFETLRRRAPDIERLRRDAPNRTDKVFRYSGPGYCGVCDIRIYSALDAHMMACHLEFFSLEHLAEKTWGIDTRNKNQRGPVFSPMDSDQGRLARCPPTRCIRGRRRRPSVSRSWQPIGTSVPSV